MATKTTLYGRLTVIFQNNVQIDNLLSTGLKQARASRDQTTKDSADDHEGAPTIKTRTIDFKAYASNVSSSNFEQIQNAYDAGSIQVWKFSTGVSGSRYWSASGFITQCDFSATHDGTLECDGSVEITGPVTFGVV